MPLTAIQIAHGIRDLEWLKELLEDQDAIYDNYYEEVCEALATLKAERIA